jgi:hypothetical protein
MHLGVAGQGTASPNQVVTDSRCGAGWDSHELGVLCMLCADCWGRGGGDAFNMQTCPSRPQLHRLPRGSTRCAEVKCLFGYFCCH